MSYHNPERHIETAVVKVVFEVEKLPTIRVVEDDDHMDYEVYDDYDKVSVIGVRSTMDKARQLLMDKGYKRWEVIS